MASLGVWEDALVNPQGYLCRFIWVVVQKGM